MTNKSQSVLVLLSGGIDSSACIAYYLAQEFSVKALHVDYGQVSAHKEMEAVLKICNHYSTSLNKITVNGFTEWSDGYVPGRNAFLLNTALMSYKLNKGIIAMGIHGGTNYNDCSTAFVKTMQALFDLYTDGCIQIGAPFINSNKQEIWAYCKAENVPLHLTYSCELGRKQPCGQCLSCKDLEMLYAS